MSTPLSGNKPQTNSLGLSSSSSSSSPSTFSSTAAASISAYANHLSSSSSDSVLVTPGAALTPSPHYFTAPFYHNRVNMNVYDNRVKYNAKKYLIDELILHSVRD